MIKEKQIRFIDSKYNELFKISDGDSIRITKISGELVIRKCRYIDSTHTQIGNTVYHICQFAEMMEQNRSTFEPELFQMPELCYSTIPSSGELVIIRNGEKGYFGSEFSTPNVEINRILANDKNAKLGITKAQAAAMQAGSIFGWDKPTANPKNYNADGNPVKQKVRDNFER